MTFRLEIEAENEALAWLWLDGKTGNEPLADPTGPVLEPIPAGYEVTTTRCILQCINGVWALWGGPWTSDEYGKWFLLPQDVDR